MGSYAGELPGSDVQHVHIQFYPLGLRSELITIRDVPKEGRTNIILADGDPKRGYIPEKVVIFSMGNGYGGVEAKVKNEIDNRIDLLKSQLIEQRMTINEAEARAKKATQGLMEQAKNMSQITSQFATPAQLPHKKKNKPEEDYEGDL